MKRIEYFCRNIRHGDPIEEQMEEAKRCGIIKSYTLTTLSAMNSRRNADICLWCNEIWSADHIHSCLCFPDHNCMFTCGIDFEVFAFVKVAKEGLKHVVVDDSEGEAMVNCAEKVFGEMCDTNLCISSKEAIISSAPQVFDELSQPVLSTNSDKFTEDNQANKGIISDLDNNDEILYDDKMCVSDSCILQEREAVNGVEQVFDEIPDRNYSQNPLRVASSVMPCLNLAGSKVQQSTSFNQPQVIITSNEVNKLEQNVGSVDKTLDKLESHMDCNLVKGSQLSSAHKVLDELPLPTLIKEMAEAAKAAELDAFKCDYESASDIACYLDKKSVNLPGCVVQVWRSRVRLKTNFSSLGNLNGWQYFAKVHQHRDTILAWNSYLERKHSHMPSDPFYVLNAMHFSKRRLSLHDSDLAMTLILPMALGAQACNMRVFESKVGWRAFLTFKELYSWGIQPLGCDWPCLELSQGGQIFSLRLHLGYNQIDYMLSYILIYDPGDLVFVATPLSIVFPSIQWNTRPLPSTLEDKGDFRGEEDIGRECTRELAIKSLLIPLWIFDPDIEMHKPTFLSNPTLKAPLLWPKGIYYHRNTSLFVNCIFHPNGEALKELLEDCDALLQSFNCIGIQPQMKVFDPGWILLNIVASWVAQVENNFKSIAFDPGGIDIVSSGHTIALIVAAAVIGLGLKFPAKLSMHFYVQQGTSIILEYLLVDEKYPCLCSTINLRRKVYFDAVYEGNLPGKRSVDVEGMTTIGFLRKGEVCTRLGVISSFIFDPGGYDLR